MSKLKIWYDAEGDYLEVSFSEETGEFRSTSSKRVMMKVNPSGLMIGFAVMNISTVDREPLSVELPIEELRRILEQHGVPLEF